MSAQVKWVGALLLSGVMAVGAYWYWSPLLALHNIRSAVEAQDPDRFNQHIDYASVRESLKGQMAAMMAAKLGESSGRSDIESAGTALGAMLGMAVMDKVIGAMVRPEVVMRAMSEGRLEPSAGKQPSGASKPAKTTDWSLDRISVDRLIVRASDGDTSAGSKAAKGQVSVVLDRTGFATWKVTEVRLPL